MSTAIGWMEWAAEKAVAERRAYDPRNSGLPQHSVCCENPNCDMRWVLCQVPDIGQEVECGSCGRTIREAS